MGNGAIKAQNLCVARTQPEAQIQIQIQLGIQIQIQLHIIPQLQTQRLLPLQLQLKTTDTFTAADATKLRPCISLVHWLFGAEPALVHAIHVRLADSLLCFPSSSDIYK